MAAPAARFDMGQVLDKLLDTSERIVATLPLLLAGALVVALAWWIGSWLSRRAALDRVARRNPFLRELVRTSVRWAVVLVGLVVALEIVGATKLVGAVLGTAGVLGVALGFAFKDILENYLAGLLMSLRQPFAPRDWVVIDGNEGIVVAMTSRATILMTRDGNHLRLPNAMVFRGVTLNYTRNPKRRLEFAVGVGATEDLAHAQQVGIDALAGVPGVIADPPPRALVDALSDWSVEVRYQAWVDQASHDFLLVRSEAIRWVKEALDAAGIDMPVPTYRVDMAPPQAGKRPEDAPGPRAAERLARQRPAVDTRRNDDVVDQVDAERGEHGDDLLDPSAPRE